MSASARAYTGKFPDKSKPLFLLNYWSQAKATVVTVVNSLLYLFFWKRLKPSIQYFCLSDNFSVTYVTYLNRCHYAEKRF